MSVSYGCCVLSGRGLCVGLITRPGECGVSECDLRISVMRRPWPTRGLLGHGRKIHIYTNYFLTQNVLRIYYIDQNFNPLTPNDPYSGRTAPLTSKCCILYIYSTNIGTEYFKHGIYSPFFPLQNSVCFVILTYLVPGLFTFYIQGVLKLKK